MKKQILIVALLLALGLSCQTPTQPNPTTIPVTRTVYVRDGDGNNLQGATVQLYRTDTISESSPVATGPNGAAIFSANVPPPFERYTCLVSDSSDYTTIHDTTLRLGCSDTTLEYTLVKQLTLPCTPETDQDNAKCLVCLAPGATDSAFTPWLSFTCPNALTVTTAATGATQIMSVSYYYKKSGSTAISAPTVTPPSTLNPGDQIQAKVVYKPTVVSASDIFTLTLTFSPGPIIYSFTVTGTAENCSSCNCPTADFAAQLGTPAAPIAVCVGSDSLVNIDLSKVLNPDTTSCTWLFTLQKDFPDNSVISLSTKSFPLQGGQSGGQLPITFSPQQNKVYDETATFSISTEPQNGTGMTCPHVLTVRFVGQGSVPQCTVDASNLTQPIPGAPNNNPPYNLDQCPDNSTNFKTVTLNNAGGCPVTVTLSFATPGAEWSLMSSGTQTEGPISVIVPPASGTPVMPGSVSVEVQFLPTSPSAYPGGNICSPPTNPSTNILNITNCAGTQQYPLTAYADPTCHGAIPGVLPDYNTTKGTASQAGIEIDPANSRAIEDYADGPNIWSIYATNVVRGAPGTATLNSGVEQANLQAKPPIPGGDYVQFQPTAAQTNVSSNTDACMLGCNIYQANPSECGTGSQAMVNVKEGDVLMFDYYSAGLNSGSVTHCACLYVQKIVQVAGPPALDEVILQLCYPIH
jgi:hypothetical protein